MAASVAPKVAFVNLGCRVNRVEIDSIAAHLEKVGCAITAPKEAQAIVVNTCAVTGEAEAKTRKQLRRAARLAQHPQVFATGCVANLFSDELSSLAENIEVIQQKDTVAQRVLDYLGMPDVETHRVADTSVTPTGRARPGIKVQDGCDNRCSFCIVWKARGKGRSADVQKVLNQVNDELARGAQEIVLTGINLGRYHSVDGQGHELFLPDLMELILQETPIARLRLSSIEPPDVDERLISVMREHPSRIAPFLHICLQSGCDAVLRRMKRPYSAGQYRERVEMLRAQVPSLALGCDLIVGFPGETDEEFEESYEFCREMHFAKMHIFRYSERPGTIAAELPDQVPPQVMSARAAKMKELANSMRHAEAEKLVGTQQDLLIEGAGQGITAGLFEVKVPDSWGADRFVRATIQAVEDDGALVAARAPH